MQKIFTIFSSLFVVTYMLLSIYFIEQDLDTIFLERVGMIIAPLILLWSFIDILHGFRKKRG